MVLLRRVALRRFDQSMRCLGSSCYDMKLVSACLYAKIGILVSIHRVEAAAVNGQLSNCPILHFRDEVNPYCWGGDREIAASPGGRMA